MNNVKQSVQKTLLVTGVSSGLGKALAQAALAAGHTVIGTVRTEKDLNEFHQLAPASDPQRAIGLQLDVTRFDHINGQITQAVTRTGSGTIDVLVNNAGYGHEGILEESALSDMQHQFDVNVFGAVAMIKAVLPTFRKQRSGHIINITSMGGTITMPGISYYCGSKFALEGISDTLAQELAPFNIAVTAVAPGSFRTDWAGRSMQRSARSIADYDASFNPVRSARMAKSGHQTGNPHKAALAILHIIDCDAPPRHLLLGSDALQLVRAKLTAQLADIDAWEALTRSTDG